MKLVRYGRPGHEKPGLIDNEGKLRDLSGIVDDISPDVHSFPTRRSSDHRKSVV